MIFNDVLDAAVRRLADVRDNGTGEGILDVATRGLSDLGSTLSPAGALDAAARGLAGLRSGIETFDVLGRNAANPNGGSGGSGDRDESPGVAPPDHGDENTGSILDTMTNAVHDLREGYQDLDRELCERIDRIPAALNEYGYDPWGFHPDTLKKLMIFGAVVYRYYFRCETVGLERLPEGRMMLIGNHAGQVAFDGAMVMTALVMEAEPPRIVRGMGEYWLGTLPWFSILMERSGSAVGTPETCVAMLRDGEAVMAFPEGVRGMNKVYADAYKLMDFGLGFMRLALETDTPVVPVSIVGSEEQQPGIANLRGLGRLLGMPSFPVTLTFPWLGPLGLLPLPVRYRIEFGEPLYFEGHADDEDHVIAAKVDHVKEAIQAGLDRGLARRESIFT